MKDPTYYDDGQKEDSDRKVKTDRGEDAKVLDHTQSEESRIDKPDEPTVDEDTHTHTKQFYKKLFRKMVVRKIFHPHSHPLAGRCRRFRLIIYEDFEASPT